MAECSVPNVVQESVRCSVCFEIFENPQMLPCGHSLCGEPRQCMTRTLDSQPCCPCCRTDFLQIQGENGRTCLVMPNYCLKAVVEGMKEAQQKKTENQPVLCEFHAKPLDLFCNICVELICYHCHVENHSDSQHHNVEIYSSFAGNVQDKFLGKHADFQRTGQKLQQRSRDISKVENQLFKTVEEMKNVICKINGNVSRRSFEENRANIVKLMTESGELIQKLQENNRLREESIATVKTDLSAVRNSIWEDLKLSLGVRCYNVPKLRLACIVGDKIVCVDEESNRFMSINRLNGEAVHLKRIENKLVLVMSPFDNVTIQTLELHTHSKEQSAALYSLSGSDLTETERKKITLEKNWLDGSFITDSTYALIYQISDTSIEIVLFESGDRETRYNLDLPSKVNVNLHIIGVQVLPQGILMVICTSTSEQGAPKTVLFILDLKKSKQSSGFLRRIKLSVPESNSVGVLDYAIVPSEDQTHWCIFLRRDKVTILGRYAIDISNLKDGVTIQPSACELNLTEEEIKETRFIAAAGINKILWQDNNANTRILNVQSKIFD